MHEPNRGCERLKTPRDVAVKADPAEKDLLPPALGKYPWNSATCE